MSFPNDLNLPYVSKPFFREMKEEKVAIEERAAKQQPLTEVHPAWRSHPSQSIETRHVLLVPH